MEGNFSGNFSHGSIEYWFEFAGVSNNRGFEKSGVKLQCWSEANLREATCNWFELSCGRFEKPRVRDIGILVYFLPVT